MNPSSNPILVTARLILRPFTRADLEVLYRLVYADPLVKNTWSGAAGTPQELKDCFASRWIDPPGPFGLKAVCLRESGSLIGLMGFQLHEPASGNEIYYLLTAHAPVRCVGDDPSHPDVELTYALGRAYWKQGYALEMGRSLIEYGFTVLKIRRIIQGVLATNANSIRLMQRLGFQIQPGLDPAGVVGILERKPQAG